RSIAEIEKTLTNPEGKVQPPAPAPSRSDEPQPPIGSRRMPWKDGVGTRDLKMPAQDLAQDVPKVGRHREVPAFVELLAADARPLAEHVSTSHGSADHERNPAMP